MCLAEAWGDVKRKQQQSKYKILESGSLHYKLGYNK